MDTSMHVGTIMADRREAYELDALYDRERVAFAERGEILAWINDSTADLDMEEEREGWN